MTTFTITHISAATILLQIGSLRLLTDPVFDPPGGHYSFGWGTGSVKLTAPTITPAALGPIDAILLSHDQHQDNLDKSGRDLLPQARQVLTTTTGARRLRGNAQGLASWQSIQLTAGQSTVKVTATPAQHGPLIVRPFAGPTIGFFLEWAGQQTGGLYISGDTIFYRGITEVAQRCQIGVAILHLGRASFPITGPIRFTMDARDGIKAVQTLRPHTVIPIHYEGWKHFRQGRTTIESQFAAARLSAKIEWLPLGTAVSMEM